ncbi:transcriptional regulation of mitochondrial recombination-domain-containing protein [Xylariaceae sp. FL1651]|nr:transcriptional regulation of mitochondrial recombination-domain-containing protein [Xylariaceae sp. FL1651]
MALRISPITAQLGRLPIGGASTICIRLAHTARRKKGERIEPDFEPGHGEKIFVFNHFMDGMTVYSHGPVLKQNRALRQIPFNGKKLKPAKLRKDYWRPMAMIQFPEGMGEVGRSVFQRLRECKKLHEYAWDDSLLYGEGGRTLTRRERGRRLNDQRANTIADMAAVLGGLGKGNKIVLDDNAAALTPAAEGEGAGEPGEKEASAVAATPSEGLLVKAEDGKTLVKATVFWSNAYDRKYATKWTKNVTHELFEEAILVPREVEEAAEEALEAEGEDGESQKAPAELVAEQELTKGAEQSQKL